MLYALCPGSVRCVSGLKGLIMGSAVPLIYSIAATIDWAVVVHFSGVLFNS